ncbi:FIST C-terminal domain-containing protein [Myxococcus sp. CA051A]|uniref:FIST signal transduction protein n=1 Tax=unclassified Myxococcus TaxID=2648731 RepID=UPI00157A2A01|nr:MULTISPECIES: FIST N-terminal domain-containing protein [unclassified Myxococcus]NTX17814.1 FIST C-terminal domain-containing protein [Myxococcus sp. CA056]NTX39586.1 FIST C-terminal domain-containing protein [Myxococcus sp. CA033]NTX50598.1 FIST C-terminal domain-containing protein [Myxococcus sp. CA039A]NTX66214.1 FIST C-terminal domain-containing protein [Myxococcus sp. CA051A]
MWIQIGKSNSPDCEAAAHEAIQEALREGDDARFALVLCTDQYDAASLASAVQRELGDIPWAGCSAAGVFAGAELLLQGLVVALFRGKDFQVGVGMGGPVSEAPRLAGRSAVAQAVGKLPPKPPEHRRALIILPDALSGNPTEVVRGAQQEAGAGIGWVGGGAGNNLQLVKAAQFTEGQAYRDQVVVIALDTLAPIGVGIQHGWHPYGPPTQVTKARGATAVELEYECAFEVYRRTAASRGDVLDEKGFARFAMTHPLGIPQANGEFVIRDPLAVEPDGAVRCVAEVPDGSLVRVMEGERADLLDAAARAATLAREATSGTLGGAVVFDCISRYHILGEEFRDELARFQDALGEDTPVVGCLTLGEVGALGGGVPQFHNKTAVVLALPG